MSRVGKQPIELPEKVEVDIRGSKVTVKGTKGELYRSFHPDMEIKLQDGILLVERPTDQRGHRALHGLTRALLANMVQGVSEGFSKTLEIHGVGYRAQLQGRQIQLALGFSHPVNYAVPEGISIETPSQTEIVIKGMDKQKVGQVAAEIRAYRPPEPYKGKGVRYADERVLRKEAKKK